jgi:hypothetical protein
MERSKMPIDPLEFGRVLARLDAQDRTLNRLEQEVSELREGIVELKNMLCAHDSKRKEKIDWMELLAGAIFGAVFYFIGQKIIGG